MKKFDPTVAARKALDEVWENALLRGRCWGLRRANNPYAGTNITFASRHELVTISMNRRGELEIHEFVRCGQTKLGRKVKKILKEKKLTLAPNRKNDP